MKINKYIAGTLMAGAMLSFASCSDSFLDEQLTTAYSTDYFKTEQGLQDLTVSLYGNLRWHFGYEWAYGITLYGTDEFSMGNDNTSQPWNEYNSNLNPMNFTKEMGAPNGNCPPVDALWNEMYYGIASCNIIISSADKITNEVVRNQCLAQAYFMRGYNYYRLAAQYGSCVLQLEPAAGVVRNFEKSNPEQVWAQVISDLRTAYETFRDEDYIYGPNTLTKATAAHFLAKALLFRCSERNDSWNSAYKAKDLDEAIAMCDYVIKTRPLEQNYSRLYADWNGEDCDIEFSKEILMASPTNQMTDKKVNGRYGNRTAAYFHSQFQAGYAGDWVKRGMVTGGKDFQRCVPTEYTYAVYDHVNDARLWKTFRTVYGTNNVTNANADKGVALGDPAIVMILNKQDDHTYDNYKFGCFAQGPTFKDDNCRLPDWTTGVNTPNSGKFSAKAGQFVPNVSILYQGGKFVRGNFGTNNMRNFFAGINKTTDGAISADGSDTSVRDVTMARVGETYLIRAELYVRKGDYASAMKDINVIRARASWKAGENRSYYIDGSQAAYNNANVKDKAKVDQTLLTINTYYLSNPEQPWTTAASDLTLKSFPSNLPAEDEAVMKKLGVSGDYQRALHFILNERTRELIGEWQRWETLSRTGTLVLRAKAFNPDANPVAGKHELRPIPQSFLDQLKNGDGTNLSDEQKAAWQNPGY